MVDLGGGLLHSGLKSSFVMFIPTNMVPIEQVNDTLSRRSIIYRNNFVDFKIFQLKMSSCKTPAAIFIPTKMATETWHFEMKCFQINEIIERRDRVTFTGSIGTIFGMGLSLDSLSQSMVQPLSKSFGWP